MGRLEEESKKRRRKNDIRKAILLSVKVAGLLSVALLAPNAIRVLKDFGLMPKKRQKEIIITSRNRLVKNGLLRYDTAGLLQLTEKGEKELRVRELKDFKLPKPKKWDGKWRVLSFDIKESRRITRDDLRRTLVSIGFRRVHLSLWIYPYDCEDFVTLLKADMHIGGGLLYMIVDSIENDKVFRTHFGLR